MAFLYSSHHAVVLQGGLSYIACNAHLPHLKGNNLCFFYTEYWAISLYSHGLLYSAAKEELPEVIFIFFPYLWLSPQAKQRRSWQCDDICITALPLVWYCFSTTVLKTLLRPSWQEYKSYHDLFAYIIIYLHLLAQIVPPPHRTVH